MTSCAGPVLRSPNKLRIVQDPDAGVVFPELPEGNTGREILYGRELLVNTSYYFGKKGIIKPLLSSAVQCQSCHLDAGTRMYGNHLLLSYKKFPSYFPRTGQKITLEERIHLCIKDHYRGFNSSLPENEMRAIKNYLRWISKSKFEHIEEAQSSFMKFAFPGRKASRDRGKKVYAQHCLRCHGSNGAGEMTKDNIMYLYPPLWADKGYSLNSPFLQNYRLAQFIRATMPFGARPDNPILSEEEALDVAVFINNRPRWGEPSKKAFPKTEEKPFDFPFEPYPDPFPRTQHQLGPFGPILEYRTTKKLPTLPY